jgi:predicted anti-sigma-YlaC factor YlaD
MVLCDGLKRSMGFCGSRNMRHRMTCSNIGRGVSPGWMAGLVLTLVMMVVVGSGCSVKKMAVNRVGDLLASGGAVLASDEDPELVRAAAPFGLKLMESLLAESPRHQGLLFSTASGFTQYAYAFVQQDADELEATDLAGALALRERARRLYLRARDYGLRGLEAAHPGFRERLFAAPETAVGLARRRDVRLLYWTAVSWGAAISLSKDDPHRVAEVPQMEALIDRALELDESFGQGAIHAFLITYEMSRQGAAGDPGERAAAHFRRALELGAGQLVGPLVAYAEAVCVQRQDWREFDRWIEEAVAMDPDLNPEYRLANRVMQRRARWLGSLRDELFLIPDEGTGL